jgi:hypothetical protein
MRQMKLFVCIAFLTIQGSYCHLSSQINSDKFNISYENLRFSSILDSLSYKFKVNFSYNADLPFVKKVKSVSCFAGLEDILGFLFKDENLDYSIIENQVVIFPIKSSSQVDSLIKKEESFVSVNGVILDKNDHNPLPFASVSLSGKSISTVGNTYGEFIFRIPKKLQQDTIVFSYIGYQSEYLVIENLSEKQLKIELAPIAIPIMAVIIKPYSGLELVKDVVKNISKNYSNKCSMYTAFYRETTREENDYVSICEAVLDIAKAPYNRELMDDQAKIFKGRRSENVKKIRNLKYKLEGGVYNSISLDIIKDLASFFSEEYFNDYEYEYIKQMVYENRDLYVIAFDQKENVQLPLFKGLLYIDAQTKALVASKFGLSPRGIKYAQDLLVKKQPHKFQVKPVSTEYQVYYRFINGKWYLAYMRGELITRAKSTKLFFNSTFTSVSEMVITEIDTTNKMRFKRKEIAKPNDILVDNVSNSDENFWSNYVIIQPEQSLQLAIKKLNIKKALVPDESLWKKLF